MWSETTILHVYSVYVLHTEIFWIMDMETFASSAHCDSYSTLSAIPRVSLESQCSALDADIWHLYFESRSRGLTVVEIGPYWRKNFAVPIYIEGKWPLLSLLQITNWTSGPLKYICSAYSENVPGPQNETVTCNLRETPSDWITNSV